MSARPPSLQRRLYLLMALLAIVSLASSVMLVVLTRTIRLHAEELAEVLRDGQRVEALRIQLVWFERTRNLALIRGEALPFDGDAARELRDALARVERGYASAEPGEYNRVAAAVRSYLSARLAAERQGGGVAAIEARIGQALQDALDACDDVLDRDEERAGRAQAAVLHWDAVTDVAGVTCALLLIMVVVLWLVVTRRSVFEPLFRLRDAILQFSQGHLDARLPPAAPRELREVSETFNHMADKIEHERERRLAFLAAVAHDMANPLMAMKMSAAVVRGAKSLSEERWRSLFDRVDRQVARLHRMVEDLLDASRIEAGRLELRRSPFDLRDLVHEAAELHLPLPSSHRLTLELPDGPVQVHADETRISQVLNNLISNALKYSPEGGEIRIQLGALDGQAELKVSDQGIGIAPEELPRVFEPFRRSRSVHDTIPGVGLGLSVVRRIVMAHGGSIDVKSELGVGTTFRVLLPLAASPAEQA